MLGCHHCLQSSVRGTGYLCQLETLPQAPIQGEAMKTIAMSLVALFLLAPWAFAQSGIVRVGGAGLLSDLTLPLVEKYTAGGSTCKFALAPSTTGGGFKKWIAGEVQLVQATRKITDREKKEASDKGLEPSHKFIGIP